MEKSTEVIFNGHFGYRGNDFFAEDIPVRDIAARFGTPCYVYSRGYIQAQITALKKAFASVSPKICYSVKANSNLVILGLMSGQGLGADAVSEGEVRRALLAGFDPSDVVFAGVGKKPSEIEYGIRRGIFCFNVENTGELDIIEAIGRRLKKRVNCALRINPDIDVDTHHYVKTARKETKFGIELDLAGRLISRRKNLRWAQLNGLHFHLGSQLKEPSAYLAALNKTAGFCRDLGFAPEILDIGGGFGIAYSPSDKVSDIGVFGQAICAEIKKWGVRTVVLEPGRFLIGNTAVLLARVLYYKDREAKKFVITDAGMNDLIRPAFYGSYHHILPAARGRGRKIVADVVGPICESGDYIGKDREFPVAPKPDDLIVAGSAGAYAFSMASNYNSRPRPCEVLVSARKVRVIRARESYEDLWRNEKS